MPGKNKPKRLDRHRSWRVARRKKKINLLTSGNSRNRKLRPKKKMVSSSSKDMAKVIKKDTKKLEENAKDLLAKVAVNNK